MRDYDHHPPQPFDIDSVLDLAAGPEGKTLRSKWQRNKYLSQLMRRRVIVDNGPHPCGRGRAISVDFDCLKSEQGVTLQDFEQLVMRGSGPSDVDSK